MVSLAVKWGIMDQNNKPLISQTFWNQTLWIKTATKMGSLDDLDPHKDQKQLQIRGIMDQNNKLQTFGIKEYGSKITNAPLPKWDLQMVETHPRIRNSCREGGLWIKITNYPSPKPPGIKHLWIKMTSTHPPKWDLQMIETHTRIRNSCKDVKFLTFECSKRTGA